MARVLHRSLSVTETPVGRRLARTRIGDEAVETWLRGSDAAALRDAVGDALISLRQVGGGLLARVAKDGAPAETGLLAGRRCLLALRNAEPAGALPDWFAYHGRMGVTGAVIFDRSAPDDCAFEREAEAALAGLPDDLTVLIVRADAPLGAPDQPDARLPAMAPGAPAHLRESQLARDAWHAPFAETVLLETLRWRYLAEAKSVAFLDIADLVAPDRDGSVFDRAELAPGQTVPMAGREVYPWRLRRGRTAPHADHIYTRRDESRWVTRWCVAPSALSGDAVWRMVRIAGSPAAEGGPARFFRAMGVVFPGAAVAQLVDKTTLVEDRAAAAALGDAFGVEPLRRPSPRTPGAAPDGPVVVVTAMKNEGPYILDWIAHHRTLGVRRFIVYTNDCDDGTDALLDALSDAGVVRRDNPFRRVGGVPQHAAFRAAESEDAVRGAGWLLTLDVDEYLNIRAGSGRLADLFSAAGEANVISMPWRLFGSGDLVSFEDRPVVQQFPCCAPEYAPRPHQAWGFKTLYRNAGLFRRLGVHRPRGIAAGAEHDIRWIDGSGRPLPPPMWRAAWRMTDATWGYDLVSVNHYAVRSAEAYLVKRDRGRVNHVDRDQGTAYWFRMNHNAARDHSIRRLDAAVAAERASLARLPGVAEAHDAAVAWHKARIGQLLQEPSYRALFDEITGPRLRRLSRMLPHFGANVFLAGPQVIPDEVVARDPDGAWTFTVPNATRRD